MLFNIYLYNLYMQYTHLLHYPHYMNHITTSSWMPFHNMSNLYSTHQTLLHSHFNPIKPHPLFASTFKSLLETIHHYNPLNVNASSHRPPILNVCPFKRLQHKPPNSHPPLGILSIKISSKISQPWSHNAILIFTVLLYMAIYIPLTTSTSIL